jgi:hypothetical protein
VPGLREWPRRGAYLGERRGHHVRCLARRRECLDRLRHQVVRVTAVLLRDLPVLLLDDEEPRELLIQLRQALADEFKAADDGTDVVRIGQLAAAVGELVQHRDRVRRPAGDLARRHGARQLGHLATTASRAHGCTSCLGIRLLGGIGVGVTGLPHGVPAGPLIYTIRPR